MRLVTCNASSTLMSRLAFLCFAFEFLAMAGKSGSAVHLSCVNVAKQRCISLKYFRRSHVLIFRYYGASGCLLHTHTAVETDDIAVGPADVLLMRQYGQAVSS